MSESDPNSSAQEAAASAVAPEVVQLHASPTAGGLLKAAREKAGLHVAALAVSLKVPVRKLEALESNQLSETQDPVFVRALAGSVCRALKIDSGPVLALMPSAVKPSLGIQGRSLNQSFRSPADGPGMSWVDQLSRPGMLAAVAVVVGALVLALLPQLRQAVTSRDTNSVGSIFSSSDTKPEVSQPTPVATGGSPVAPDGSFLTETKVIAPQVGVSGSPVAASLPVEEPKLAATSALAGSVGSSEVSTLNATSASGLIVFRAKGQVWVEGVDANGQVLIRRVLASSESVGITGATPIKVIVGRTDQAEVTVRGKAFDLVSASKDNIAKFEVR